jgi:hypothetical protein
MINPKTVLIMCPSYNGAEVSAFTAGLMRCAVEQLFGNYVGLDGCAWIDLARNIMMNRFYSESSFEWAVFIDSDIGFTPDDFRMLMNYPPYKRVVPEKCTVNADGEPLIVTCPYARKVDVDPMIRLRDPNAPWSAENCEAVIPCIPVNFGLGFTRIHRSVIDILRDAKDNEGVPRVGEFKYKGKYFLHLFPQGPAFDGTWLGEDHGFFHLCALAGITPVVEHGTRLTHTGTKTWKFDPANIFANVPSKGLTDL